MEPGGYPSPTPNNQLPFYDHTYASAGHIEDHQNNHDLQQQQGTDDDESEVDDGGQAPASLRGMVGSFGAFGGAQQAMQQAGLGGYSALPQGSVAYAQATGSPGAAPSSTPKSKERTKVSRACDECRRKKVRDPHALPLRMRDALVDIFPRRCRSAVMLLMRLARCHAPIVPGLEPAALSRVSR